MKTNSQVAVLDKEPLVVVSNDNFVVVYNSITQTLTINSNIGVVLESTKDLTVRVHGDLHIECTDDFNLLAGGRINLDSRLPECVPSLFLNSSMASQIRGTDAAVAQRIQAYNQTLEDFVQNNYCYDKETPGYMASLFTEAHKRYGYLRESLEITDYIMLPE